MFDWWEVFSGGISPDREVEHMGKKHKIKKLEKRIKRTLDEIREVLGQDVAEAFALSWVKNLAAATGVSKLPLVMEEMLRVAGFSRPQCDEEVTGQQITSDIDAGRLAKARREREVKEASNRLCIDELIRGWVRVDPLSQKMLVNRLTEMGERSGDLDNDEMFEEACENAAALLHALPTRKLLYAGAVVHLLANIASKDGLHSIPTDWQSMVNEELERRRLAQPTTWKGLWIDTVEELLPTDFQRNAVHGEVMPPKDVPEDKDEPFTAIDSGIRQWGDTAEYGHIRAIRVSKRCLFVMPDGLHGNGPKALVWEATKVFALSRDEVEPLFGENAASGVIGAGKVGLTMHYLGSVGDLRVSHEEKEDEDNADA